MLRILRRLAATLAAREDRDDRLAKPRTGLFVQMIEADLANLDSVARAFTGRDSCG